MSLRPTPATPPRWTPRVASPSARSEGGHSAGSAGEAVGEAAVDEAEGGGLGGGGLGAALIERVAQAERDLTMLLRGLMGIRARPFVERRQARFGHLRTPRPAGVALREVEIVEVLRETAAATTLRFRPVAGGDGAAGEGDGAEVRDFEVSPGQFFTVEVTLPGQPGRAGATLRRAYSCSNACLPGELPAITVKRVPGGRVSNWLNDEAHVGMRLRVLGPSGSFGPRGVGARGVGARDVGSRGAGGAVGGPVGAGGLARGSTPALLLIAGGSGITPLMAIARTVLAVDPEVRVALVYGNRSVDDIIFLDALDDLARAHGARFHVVHALEHPIGADVAPARAANFAEGRLDAATFERLAATLPPGLRPATAAPSPSAAAGGPAALTAGCPEIYLCGPAPMMAEVRGALASLGVAPAHIHEESFLRPEQRAGAPASTQVVLLRKRGVETHAVVPGGKTLLEAGLAAGVDMPYSCAMGGCAACKVKLVAGEVDMEEPNCLDPAERDAGFVLGCVARPKTPCVVEVP